jgi:proline iminopeptidase
MEKSAGKMRAGQALYPPLDPYDRQMLDVGDGHALYVEQCGNPAGVPVVVLHGGPGGGCSPSMRRYFDPEIYRIVLFDQRGCGRSRPHASVEANTTWHLVADIERIRTTLGIRRWLVFGGSWGATLALVYAQTHPGAVAFLALRGVFLMTAPELRWFYGGGAAAFWPAEWAAFTGLLPEAERGDVIAAYHRRLFGPDMAEQVRFSRAWLAWENALAALEQEHYPGDSPAEYARAFARLENHYFTHAGFLGEGTGILERMQRIAAIPGVVVQGRYDMICPPASAHALVSRWPAGELRMIPTAGHALSEPGISSELVRTMDALRDRLRTLDL